VAHPPSPVRASSFTMVVTGTIVAAVTASCERLPWDDAPAPRLMALSNATPSAKAERNNGDSHWLRQRLRTPPAMPTFEQRPCPDSVLGGSILPRERTLAVLSVDRREQQRNLVPRRLSELLMSPDVEAALAATRASGSDPLGVDAQTEPREQPTAKYLGLLFVTDYTPPRLIIRMGELKHEWLDGTLTARLVIYDGPSSEALCAVPISAHTDTKDAPTRLRIQADTRAMLERQLGQSVRDAARRGLSEISKVLVWPELRGQAPLLVAPLTVP
jgi:hypothetical protein